jgi:hypothetical protein
MVETIVPVVHGTRTWLASVLMFGVGAVSAAALLGLLLGAALPAGGALAALLVAAFAALEAAAELGLVTVPLPQLRRQVPERWRERYPQPVTALLYGAGLGVGFATYLPVATLLVVAAGVAALAGPAGGAAVLAGFGLGRTLALAAATARVRSYEQAGGRVERMAALARGGRLRRVNALALGLLAVVLASAAATGEAQAATRIDLGTGSFSDPSAAPGVLAFDRIDSGGSLTGVVRMNGTFTDLPGIQPDVDGTQVVVDTGPAFEIIDLTTMNVLRTLNLAGRDPALSGNWMAYRRTQSGVRQIVLYHLTDDTSTVIAHAKLKVDLGPPDISYPRVVFHRTGPDRSSIVVYRIDHDATRLARTTVRFSYFNPSVDGTSVVYIAQNLDTMSVRVLNLHTNHSTSVYRINKGSGRFLWTTGISGTRRYFTVYNDTSSWIDRG